MPKIDINPYLKPVSADLPSGKDIRTDPKYLELFKLAEGKPEVHNTPAVEPNWNEVISRSTELLDRTKEIKLITVLMVALLRAYGITGLNAGMELLLGTLKIFWDTLHPLPEDPGDYYERLNAIADIGPPQAVFGDLLRYRQRLRETPLARSPQLGQFSLRDIMLVAGKKGAVPGVKFTDQSVESAFTDTAPELLQETNRDANEALSHFDAVIALLKEKVGEGSVPDLSGLREDIAAVIAVTQKHLMRRDLAHSGKAVVDAKQENQKVTSDKQESTVPTDPVLTAPAAPGVIRNRQDVIDTLDKIIAFYAASEPSSPLPILLNRAKKLVSKSFIEIVKELSPEAMAKLLIIGGADMETPPKT